MRDEQARLRIQEIGLPALGQRYLRTRNARRLSVRDLAELSQVSKNTITRIEKGYPAQLSTLKILARALRVRWEYLLDKDFNIGHAFAVHRISEARWFDIDGYESVKSSPEVDPGRMDINPFCILASRDESGRFHPNVMVINCPTPMRAHRGEEFAFVLEGQLAVVFDDRRIELETGESIYFWAAEKHRYEPISEGASARVLSIILDPDPVSVELKYFRKRRS